MKCPVNSYLKTRGIKNILKDIFFSFAWLIVLIFAIDIASKWIVVANLGEYEEITVIAHFFYLRLSFNEGAAFGLGNTGDIGWRIFFIAVSSIIGTVMLIFFIAKYKKLNAWTKVAAALMIAGAYGNLVDRAFYWDATVGFSGVVDFLSFEFWGNRFATFNIADSSLVVGVIVLLIAILADDFKASKNRADRVDLSKPPVEYLEEKNRKDGSKKD